eukprot:COSAG02_NODE_6456_length_3560_cov_41.391794_5_plen_358_part_00
MCPGHVFRSAHMHAHMLRLVRAGKSIDCDTAALLGELPATDCPYCTKPPVKFVEVSSMELARNYEDSPAVAQKLASRIPDKAPGAPSPLKTGDSYEDMKRKMTFFDESNGTTPEKTGATNPVAVASVGLDSSGGATIRTALETSLRSMPTVPESPGQASSIGSATPPGTPSSPGSAAASPAPYVSQLDMMEEGGQAESAEAATPRNDDEDSPQMDRSCPAGLANALAAAGEGHVSVLDEASLIAPHALLQPEPEQEPESGPGEEPRVEQEQQPEHQPGLEPEQREPDSSVLAAVDGSDVPGVPPDEAAAAASEPPQAMDASSEEVAAPEPSPAVDVSDMPDAAEEAADNPADPPPSE